MDDPQLKAWVEEQYKLGGLKAFIGRIDNRMESITKAVLMPGEHEYEKGQVAALQWVCNLPESITTEEDDTGADT